MKSSRWIAVASVTAALTQVATFGYAAPSPTTILQNMVKAQSSIKTFRARQTISGSGFMMGSGSSQVLDIAVQKPNKMRAEIHVGKAPKPAQIIVCDGKTAWRYFAPMNQYVKMPPPKNMDMFMPVGGSRGQEFLKRASKGARFLRSESVHGIGTNVIKITEGGLPTTLWIGTKDSLPYRVVIDSTAMRNKMVEMMAKQAKKPVPKMTGTAITTIELANIQVNKPIPASLFKFTPPKGAKEMKMPTGGAPGMRMGAPAKPPKR